MQDQASPGDISSGININFIRGNKFFELSNHLGNVLATVGDAKRQISANSSTVDYYEAKVMSAQDYYPFGMLQPGRKFSTSEYRYGFNGQEKSDEIKGEGNSYTAQFWEYDPRIGRRLNLDPVDQISVSNYACFSNSPLIRIDPEGDNDYTVDKKGHIVLSKKTDAKNHTIFNADGSKSTTVGLNFFKSTFQGASTVKGNRKESTVILGRNLDEMGSAYKFLAENTDVEWQYSILEGKSKIGALVSSHTPSSILSYVEAVTYMPMYSVPSLKLLYKSHSHPGKFDPRTGWPAYPSGFTYQLQPDLANPGDRDNYKYYKDNFKGRIPETFNIITAEQPKIHIEHDDQVVIRTQGNTSHTITITNQPKKAKK